MMDARVVQYIRQSVLLITNSNMGPGRKGNGEGGEGEGGTSSTMCWQKQMHPYHMISGLAEAVQKNVAQYAPEVAHMFGKAIAIHCMLIRI